MMILAFFGDNYSLQEQVVSNLESTISGFNIEHVENHRDFLSADQKIGRIQRLVASRNRRNTLTIVTGITEVMEYQLLLHRRAVFCILPGALPPILSRGYIPIDRDFIYVSLTPDALETEAKRRIYMKPDEAFSECYRREFGGKRS